MRLYGGDVWNNLRGESDMKQKGSIYWIILGALGIFLIIGHNAALGLVCKVIGAALAVCGVMGIVNYFRDKAAASPRRCGQ